MGRRSRWDHIQSAAAKLFATKGFQAATMDDITAETGISKGGLYYHGRSKEEILHAICHYSIGGLLTNARRVLAEVPDPVGRLAGIMHAHMRFFFDHPYTLKVLNAELHNLTGDLHAEIVGMERQYVDIVRGILGELDAAGRLRVEPVIGTFAFFSLVNHLDEWYHPRGRITPEYLIAQYQAVFLEGTIGMPGVPPSLQAETRRSLV